MTTSSSGSPIAGPSRVGLARATTHPSPPRDSTAPQTLSSSGEPPPPRADGFDNYPPELPSDPEQLAQRLARDPDVEKQLALQDPDVGPPPDGGREAWLVVFSAFGLLMCIYGFGTSHTRLLHKLPALILQ